jgi:hypothetical protein
VCLTVVKKIISQSGPVVLIFLLSGAPRTLVQSQ